ncbi:hypothetical protein BXO88_03970 [Oribacterium sp. C9]|uniref:hypothetical protein n=1 Tax=Oribacterium sp. C9 TaxID=1943579 RepID=UPI00098FD177|nr:hypothetical protein [Oribacterium sp. C9]OON87439.1 hypothetical protein BXO88_03970 [Oribacterium sp. C9]
MRIKNRLSPYPILDNYSDDYINSSFSAEYELTTQFTEVYGKIKFNLKNYEIEKLIEDGYAEYLVHIECPSTCYREKISTNDTELEFKISSHDLAKLIEIRTFIVLTKPIDDFESKSFHPDYVGQKFALSEHQIIAIGTAKNFNVKKDDRDLESLPSVVQIMKMKDKKKGSYSVDTDGDDHIIIGLSEDVYELYGQLGKSTFKATSFSLILMPALIVVLQRMHMNRNDDDAKGRHWFQVIETMLNNNGFCLDDISIENDSLLNVAQSIFADPVAKSFKELDECSERM